MLRLSAAWLAPVTSPPVPRGAVLVGDDGRIVAAGPDASVPAPPDAERLALGDAVLLPGLVNVHAHPELAALRGLLEDLPFDRWIPALMRVKREARLGIEDYGVAARWTCIEALRAGITTIGATEDSVAALDALRAAGMRGVVYREVFGPAPAQADAALAGLRAGVAAMRRLETDLVAVGVSPHAPYSVSDALFVAVAAFARAEALPVAVHAAESAAEELLVRAGTGPFADGLRQRGIDTSPRAPTTVALLERTGVLACAPLLVHAIRLRDDDIARIADAGASVAHCPVANARLGHGIAPVRALHDAGVAVGLGTDSVAANNRLDLLEEARTAQLMQRVAHEDGTVLPPARLLRMATLDGARALGLADRIGAIEPGRDADLCAVSIAGAHVRPVHDPLAALFLSARASDVVLTMVRGRVLFRDGRLIGLDETGTAVALEAVATRIRDRARPT
jgi:cytosine/adenosine deaminase-related metal-dependent hydrolase